MGSDQVADVDILIVGAGVTGIYQLYRAREAGYSAQLVEAGSGVGGTWYWNRYPGCALRLRELHLRVLLLRRAVRMSGTGPSTSLGQPENERYFNHVVDKFDLRRHIRFNTRVTSAVWDEAAGDLAGHGATGTPPGPATWSPRPACCRCRSIPTSPGGRASAARPTTPACGRRPRWTSRASGSPSSAPGRAACRSSRSSPARSPR